MLGSPLSAPRQSQYRRRAKNRGLCQHRIDRCLEKRPHQSRRASEILIKDAKTARVMSDLIDTWDDLRLLGGGGTNDVG